MIQAANEAFVDLYPHQLAAIESLEQFTWVAMVTGLGGGKTRTGAFWIVSRASQFPAGVHLATGNSYTQLEDTILPALFEVCGALDIHAEWRSSKRIFLLDGGALGRILVRSTENYNRLRGMEVDSWWADEVRDAPKKAVQVMRGRMRGKHCDRPRVFWGTTPNGYDHVWEEFVKRPSPNHRLIRARTIDNLSLPSDYVPSLIHGYDPQLLKQEMDGEFLNLAGARAVGQFDRLRHVRKLEYNPDLPLFLCHDFNVNPLLCVVAQEIACKAGGTETHFLDEFALPHANVYHVADAVGAKYGSHPGRVTLFGDASGHGRTAQTGRTYYAMLLEAFGKYFGSRVDDDVPKDAPPIVDRINATNARFMNGAGEVRAYVDPACELLIDDCEQCVWKKPGVVDKEDPKRTHALEAAGYYLHRRHRPSAFRAPDLEVLRGWSR